MIKIKSNGRDEAESNTAESDERMVEENRLPNFFVHVLQQSNMKGDSD